MLYRTFTFTDDRTGQIDFRLLYEAFRSRDPSKCTKDERQHLAAMQTALDGISEPVGDLTEDQILDLRFRKLLPGEHTISLKAKTFERLETCVTEAPFQSGLSAPVAALEDRLSAAEKVQREDPK